MLRDMHVFFHDQDLPLSDACKSHGIALAELKGRSKVLVGDWLAGWLTLKVKSNGVAGGNERQP